MASIELVFRGGTQLRKLDPIMTEYVHPDRIAIIVIGNDVAYISDKNRWTYVFIKVNSEWLLDKVIMKRRYGNGRHKASFGRNDERKRNNRRPYNKAQRVSSKPHKAYKQA